MKCFPSSTGTVRVPAVLRKYSGCFHFVNAGHFLASPRSTTGSPETIQSKRKRSSDGNASNCGTGDLLAAICATTAASSGSSFSPSVIPSVRTRESPRDPGGSAAEISSRVASPPSVTSCRGRFLDVTGFPSPSSKFVTRSCARPIATSSASRNARPPRRLATSKTFSASRGDVVLVVLNSAASIFARHAMTYRSRHASLTFFQSPVCIFSHARSTSTPHESRTSRKVLSMSTQSPQRAVCRLSKAR
mmetsp:Transcript_10556/g.39100  ORF Transcript_10556/g.39100 Transcript_10556/m.39100 type:complete len:247 (-) Transcript_10556:178-918(-)